MERKNAWKTYSEEDISKLNAISAEYVKFLDNGKTERECVAQTVEMAKAKGYRNLNTVIANGEKLNPGDCVYSDFMDGFFCPERCCLQMQVVRLPPDIVRRRPTLSSSGHFE